MNKRAKLQELLDIERSMQQKWEEDKIFEVDAPKPGALDEHQEKYMVNFPFPYMNGRVHLGHTFTLSKCEFAAGFQRMLGKRCMFPFAMHCTGMPIKACADKLRREMSEYGYPPKFSDEQDPKKNSSGSMHQWQIMASMGLKDEEIKLFADPVHWLQYFPPYWIKDLKRMGLKVDWRRAYISTDANPFFDSFVHWTFIRLKERNRIKFGRRYTIFSPKENQPCMDHDRSSGEEVGLQEFTLIKLKVKTPYPPKLSSLSSRRVYLVAATLRPETMFGQTNCWVRPDLKYVAIEVRGGDVYISTRRAARNMSYQDITPDFGSLNVLAEFVGQDIIGLELEAPLTSYKTIYSLPMLNITENKGTGILTSVPSDVPEDFQALRDLQTNQLLRQKHGITEQMVSGIKPIAIIDTPGYGPMFAAAVCSRSPGTSHSDTDTLLTSSKNGHCDGVMLVKGFEGQKVLGVRKPLQTQMVNEGDALVYMEPEKLVMSRSGDECVAALCDQWYLDYGEPGWRAMAKRCLSKMEIFFDEVREGFEATMDCLDEHACSRTYGLGSRIPWDTQYLIENMSDSNVNMAYYTVCQLVQGRFWDGSQPGPANIRPEQLTPDVWDYVFFKSKPYPVHCGIPQGTLDMLKREFEYWYPVDYRMSGKDLVSNNLTYFIYCHTAMWPDDETKWPTAIRANGHLLINSRKMSKSTGNFCTLEDAIDKFSADGMRMSLADAGDGVENANFVETHAETSMLRLHSLLVWVREMVSGRAELRHGDYTFSDRVFVSEINKAIEETKRNYEQYFFQAAVRTGLFDLQAKLERYRETELQGMHHDLVFRFIEVQVLLMAPICPHMAEYIWGLLGKTESVMCARWPEAGEVDLALIHAAQYLEECLREFTLRKKTFTGTGQQGELNQSPPTRATIWAAKSHAPWQASVLAALKRMCKASNGFPAKTILAHELMNHEELKNHVNELMPFIEEVKKNVEQSGPSVLDLDATSHNIDEISILHINSDYLAKKLRLDIVEVRAAEDAHPDIKQVCYPRKPAITFYSNSKTK